MALRSVLLSTNRTAGCHRVSRGGAAKETFWLRPTGVFDNETQQAVWAFQKYWGFTRTGYIPSLGLDATNPAGRTAVFLVDRVWPRGLSKADVDADWVKDVGPSTELRKWFGHDPERWQEFTQRYRAELDEQPEVTAPLQAALEQGDVLLLFDAKDTEHNQAVVLADWLRDRADGR